MRILIILNILILLLSGCAPEVPQTRFNSVQNNSKTQEVDPTINSNTTGFQKIQWYAESQYSTVLTINQDNKQNSYFRGDDIYNFLIDPVNYKETYCLIVKYPSSSSTTPKVLRVLVVPQKTVNYATGKSVYYFRVNLNSKTGNNNCNGGIQNPSVGGIPGTIDLPVVAQIANDPTEICTNCKNIISSNSVKLYKLKVNSPTNPAANLLTELDATKIDPKTLSLRININNNTNNSTGSCNASQCISLGYDCCFDNQCVTDGQVKPTVDTSNSDFILAELEKVANTSWYKNYPQYYYACLEMPPSNQGDIDGELDPSDPNGEAQERLTNLKADYECVMELDENTETTPFQVDINTSYSPVKCNLSTTTNNMYYKTVMERLYTNCGCAYDYFDAMVLYCPAYTYQPVYVRDSNGNVTEEIQDIICKSPLPAQDKEPFQDLEVILNSRSAPHRLFNSDGDDISYWISNFKPVPEDVTTNLSQEGEVFQYLDTADKIVPQNPSFGMNSILGQMNYPLTHARPAKVVELEFDKMYYIATLSGYYTPCSECAKDSWFTNFSAFPITTEGVGLRSIGYSTQRDSWDSNNTYGNYEDTIFGRACWIPPTMIPWSHSGKTSVQDQRLNRLKTQAALFVNGYQRDWWGFNRGAVIGSFDGVTWFAVGKGRIVKSSSSKLFLAINAPFADLAQPTDHIVSVQEYDFVTTGARYDYNPDLSFNHPEQNEAGSCQANHLCETDSDCVTALGWEYVCGNPYVQNTKWPVFNPLTSNEEANTSKESSIVYLLQQQEMAGNGDIVKRCVYRGAGAPCRRDYTSLKNDEGQMRSLTCAPNFYCAALNTSGVFNSEVARFAAPLENLIENNNHFFGKDANILGRPKDYIAINQNLNSLPTDVISTLNENLLTQDPTIGSNTGICLPGKVTPSFNSTANTAIGQDDTSNWNPTLTHSTSDSEYRTDFISQIGGCNSGLYTRLKYAACPALETDGDYAYLNPDLINKAHAYVTNDTTFANYISHLSTTQNSCGLETLHQNVAISRNMDADSLKEDSAFQFLEAFPLSSENVITGPTFARDACFRRAGAVCHTDYDCFPNIKHSEMVDVYGLEYFGNEAEMDFHREYLVCGQAQPKPLLTSSAYSNYTIGKNRCCREVGSDITLYTEFDLASVVNSDVEFTGTLETDKFSAFFPNDTNRYSRYSMVTNESETNPTVIDPNTRRPAAAAFPKPSIRTLADRLVGNQWKTINESAKRTCCGGGWIRKFADNTTNWSVNRMELDVENFRCLNYKTPLITAEETDPYGEADENFVRNQRSSFCWDTGASIGGCAMLRVDKATNLKDIVAPRPNSVDDFQNLFTEITPMDTEWDDSEFSFSLALSADPIAATWLDYNTYSSIENPQFRNNISIVVPTWVTFGNTSGNLSSSGCEDTDTDGSTDTPCNDFHRAVNPPASTNDPLKGVTVRLKRNPLSGGPDYQDCVKANYYDPVTNPNGNPQGLSVLKLPESYYSTVEGAGVCKQMSIAGGDGITESSCCYEFSPQSRILKIAFSSNVAGEDLAPFGDDPDNNEPAPSGCNVLGPATNPPCDTAAGTSVRGAQLIFKAAGTLAWETEHIDSTEVLFSNRATVLPHRRSSAPGNDLYYLERLGRFELVGIPQMSYLPIYCNDNYQKMVPGFFKDDYNTIGKFNRIPGDTTLTTAQFLSEGIPQENEFAYIDNNNCLASLDGGNCSPYSRTDGASAPYSVATGTYSDYMKRSVVVTDRAVDIEPVFSESKFKCCLNLGEIATSSDQCCSGHMAQNQSNGSGSNDPNSYCKLPNGTNLNVYFNRFVSADGISEDLPVDPLKEDDFNPKTGEPIITEEVNKKIVRLGELFCETGSVKTGSALGDWEIFIDGVASNQLQQGTRYNFVDHIGDREVNAGSTPKTAVDFINGYRWNHHVYCTDD